MEQEGSLWSGLPAPAVLAVFCLAESSADAIAWKCACKSFYAVCGKVDMLRLRVLGDASPAVAALETSRSEFSTWFGLDLDVAPMELVQQVSSMRRRRRQVAADSGSWHCKDSPQLVWVQVV